VVDSMMNLPYKERCLMIALKWENVFNSKHMTVEQHKEFHKDLKDNEIILLITKEETKEFDNVKL
jgi:hypothetical protein